MDFKYLSGDEVQVGDRVGIDYMNERGIVLRGSVTGVFLPDSVEAEEYGCKSTGGILIHFENGDHQLWIEADEHLILLESGEATDAIEEQ